MLESAGRALCRMLRYNPRRADGTVQEVLTTLIVVPVIPIVLLAAAGPAAEPQPRTVEETAPPPCPAIVRTRPSRLAAVSSIVAGLWRDDRKRDH